MYLRSYLTIHLSRYLSLSVCKGTSWLEWVYYIKSKIFESKIFEPVRLSRYKLVGMGLLYQVKDIQVKDIRACLFVKVQVGWNGFIISSQRYSIQRYLSLSVCQGTSWLEWVYYIKSKIFEPVCL